MITLAMLKMYAVDCLGNFKTVIFIKSHEN